jgi:hypothetical protein
MKKQASAIWQNEANFLYDFRASNTRPKHAVNQAVDCLLMARLLVIAHLEELLAMCDIKISDRRAVHEQNNLLGRAGKEIIAKLASMKRVAANPVQRSRNSTGQITSFSPSGNLPNGTTSLVSRSLAQGRTDPPSLQQATFST